MKVESKIYLRRKFSEYYANHLVAAPAEIEKREFGFGTLTEKIKSRHRSFRSEKDLQNFLRREAPYYISYSVAYYDFPENPMNEKVWRGAELVFDLDKDMEYLSSEKLGEVKEEALTLVDYLVSDFGISEGDIKINFSGSKGYHIHVLSEDVRFLGKDERKEILEYVTGELDIKGLFRLDSVSGEVFGPKPTDGGWGGRISRELIRLFENADKDKLMEIEGIGEKKAADLLRRREEIITLLREGNFTNMPEEIVKKVREYSKTNDPNIRSVRITDFRSPFIQKVMEDNRIHLEKAEDTDRMVTMDITRLIRLPDTIHGGSGLVAKTVKNLKSFNPLTDALAFSGKPTKIFLNEAVPEFDLGGKTLGPYGVGETEVPEYAAIYLLLKDKADVITSASPASSV